MSSALLYNSIQKEGEECMKLSFARQTGIKQKCAVPVYAEFIKIHILHRYPLIDKPIQQIAVPFRQPAELFGLGYAQYNGYII
jgi:hypothetical protein